MEITLEQQKLLIENNRTLHENTYTNILDKYDEWMKNSQWNPIIEKEIKTAVSFVSNKDTMIDFGCGKWTSFAFEQGFVKGLGVEITKRNQNSNVGITYYKNEMMDYKFRLIKYDYIQMIFSMFHLTEIEQWQMLNDIGFMLKQGGVVLFNVPMEKCSYTIENWQEWGHDTCITSLGISEYEQRLKLRGLSVVNTHEFTVNEGDRAFSTVFIMAKKV